jgi:hypothetical protein
MTMFGTFLISRGVVTSTQVVEALNRQRSRRVPVASIAMRQGALDAHQALQALDEEKRSGQCFADCAVGLGFVAKATMDVIQRESEASGPRLGEILIEMGALNAAELEREVHAFERDARDVASWSLSRSRRRGTPASGTAIAELVRSRQGGS